MSASHPLSCAALFGRASVKAHKAGPDGKGVSPGWTKHQDGKRQRAHVRAEAAPLLTLWRLRVVRRAAVVLFRGHSLAGLMQVRASFHSGSLQARIFGEVSLARVGACVCVRVRARV